MNVLKYSVLNSDWLPEIIQTSFLWSSLFCPSKLHDMYFKLSYDHFFSHNIHYLLLRFV